MKTGRRQDRRLRAKRWRRLDHQRQRPERRSASPTCMRFTPLLSLTRPEREPWWRFSPLNEIAGPWLSVERNCEAEPDARSVKVQRTVSPAARLIRALLPDSEVVLSPSLQAIELSS